MKFDYESLSTEPLFYMLMHSGAFVTVLGVIFFIIGLLFGYATWGRYKRQTRELRGEAAAMKEEIAQLKRKIGDHSIKSGPSVAMATETIHMPSKEGTTAAAAAPAITEETITTRDIRPPTSQSNVSSKGRLPKSRANVIKAKTAGKPATDVEPARQDEIPSPPPTEPATASISLAEKPPPPARHASPLAAIIAPTVAVVSHEQDSAVTAPEDDKASVTADALPVLPELAVAPLPALEIKAVPDPKLGLIYPSRPEKIDDLTALKGIAQVLELRLHELGIYTYAQIAHWNEENIKEFSSRLAFKDRIQRERWVEQAQQLLAKKVA